MAQESKASARLPDLSEDELYVLYGVSRKAKGFGFTVARALEKKGYTFFIVHPEVERIDEWYPIRRLADLTCKPNAALLCSPASESRRILEELHFAGVDKVYAAPGALDDAGRAFAADQEIRVCEECPLLHIHGLGFPHNLHRGILRLFRGAESAEPAREPSRSA